MDTAPATGRRRSEKRRFFWITEETSKQTGAKCSEQTTELSLQRCQLAAAPHEAVPSSRTAAPFGEAKQQVPGLGGVAAADGHGSALGAGGRELGTRLLSTASLSQRPHLPTPSLLHLLWPRESAKLRPLPWRAPGFWRSSSFQQSSLESRQRDTNFARAPLRWAAKRDGPEVVVVIATEVAGLFLVLFSFPP